MRSKNALQCLPSFNEGLKTFDNPPVAALDSPLIASKSPGSEYFSLRLEAQQSLDSSDRIQQSLAYQNFPSAASNETLETEQSNTARQRLQGLGLYILSTLLLSLQATTAKVLGEPLFELDCSLSSVTCVFGCCLCGTIYLAVRRQTWGQHACDGNGKKPCNTVWGSSTCYA